MKDEDIEDEDDYSLQLRMMKKMAILMEKEDEGLKMNEEEGKWDMKKVKIFSIK